MLNYGSSITSAFPNTFCTSPSALVCQLCNTNINESGYQNYLSKQSGNNLSLSGNSSSTTVFHPAAYSRLEKCTHCGINICSRCLNENQEGVHNMTSNEMLDEQQTGGGFLANYSIRSNNFANSNTNSPMVGGAGASPAAQSHYNTVKKEFKQMYNFSKEIVEKLHLLNNAIKIEESAIIELNQIKHQVNTKALELIKQINLEKLELVDKIEAVKRKYESMLDDRKEYFALSMQFKDELRKIIRKYKDHKSDESCSLNDLLKMYFSVKNISKKLDDFDHIKLITEQDPLQVKFDQRPVYRSLIGKLLINHSSGEITSNESNDEGAEIVQSKQEKPHRPTPAATIGGHYSSHNRGVKPSKNGKRHHHHHHHHKTNEKINKDMSRSLSLNDLIDDLNNPDNEQKNQLMSKLKAAARKDSGDLKLNEILNTLNTIRAGSAAGRPTSSTSQIGSGQNLSEKASNKNKATSFLAAGSPPPPPPPIPANLFGNSSSTEVRRIQKQQQVVSILKNSCSVSGEKCNVNKSSSEKYSMSEKLLELYRNKKTPKQRLEIDIPPSYLCCSKNKLLIASSYGKIRVIDLFSYKIQKDELKNLLINGICMPVRTSGVGSSSRSIPEISEREILYACTNSELPDQNDYLNVNNSVIIVTKNELKVLKKDNKSDDQESSPGGKSTNNNDDYLFLKPSGVCFDQSDYLYICDSGYNRVKVLDAQLSLAKLIEWASGPNDRLNQPRSVCVLDNVLYVCDSGNHRVISYDIIYKSNNQDEEYDEEEEDEIEFKYRCSYGTGYGTESMLTYPMECCIDSNRVLCVRDHHNSRVQMFFADMQQPFHYIEVNSNREIIYSMAVSPDSGDIYVAKMLTGTTNLNEMPAGVPVEDTASSGNHLEATINNKYFIDIY